MGKNPLSTEEKIDLVNWYLEIENDKKVFKKYEFIKNKFSEKYPQNIMPAKKTILYQVKNFKNFGTVLNRQKNTPHKKSVIIPDNIEKVQNCLQSGTAKSIIKIGAKTQIKRESVRKILNEQLKLYPYKIQIVQKIPENAISKRMEFCLKLSKELETNPEFLQNIWFSDESHFYLDGHCNKQNMRFWGSEKPEFFIEKSAHPLYVTVWCAMSSKGIIGPYFFENSNQEKTIVNQINYQNMIENYFVPKLKDLVGENFNNQIFQQDGASSHTAKKTLDLLKKYFDERIISNKLENFWPPYSPELNICDFYLWGYLKDSVFSNKIDNCCELKEKIKLEINKISLETCKKAINNLEFRLQYCIAKNGKHFSHIIKENQIPFTISNTNVSQQ